MYFVFEIYHSLSKHERWKDNNKFLGWQGEGLFNFARVSTGHLCTNVHWKKNDFVFVDDASGRIDSRFLVAH